MATTDPIRAPYQNKVLDPNGYMDKTWLAYFNKIVLANGGGTLTGDGTVGYLPIWTDTKILGNSIVSESNLELDSKITVAGAVDSVVGYRYNGSASGGQYLRGDGANFVASFIQAADLPGSFSGFADPTTLIGLTAVNGVANTAMRSDSAPALDLSISPIWTGAHTFSSGVTMSSTLNVVTGYRFNGAATSGQYLRGNGTNIVLSAIQAGDLPGSFSGFANPSASIGLSAINGSASTAMRSDAAPALDVGISPTWTSAHTFTGLITAGGKIDVSLANPSINAVRIIATTTTNSAAMTFNNNSARTFLGRDNSTGNAIQNGTASAYAFCIWNEDDRPILFGTNNNIRATIATTGVSFPIGVTVSGGNNLTVSGNVNINGAANATNYGLNVANKSISNSGTFAIMCYGVGDPSASNWENINIVHNGSNAFLRVDANGTGAYRPLLIQNGGATALTINTDQSALFSNAVTIQNGAGINSYLNIISPSYAGLALSNGTGASEFDIFVQGSVLYITAGSSSDPVLTVKQPSPGSNRTNIALFSSVGSFGGGVGVLSIREAHTVPTGNPIGGSILYVDPADGATKIRGSSGTITTVAPA